MEILLLYDVVLVKIIITSQKDSFDTTSVIKCWFKKDEL